MEQASIPVTAITDLLRARYGYYGTYRNPWRKLHGDWSTEKEDAENLDWYILKHDTGLYGIANERYIFLDFKHGRMPTAVSFEDAYLKRMLNVIHSSKSRTLVDKPKTEILKYAKIEVVISELEKFVRTLVSNRIKFLSRYIDKGQLPPYTVAINRPVRSRTFVKPVHGKIDLISSERRGFASPFELKSKDSNLGHELSKTIFGTNIPPIFFDIVQAGIYGEIWNSAYSPTRAPAFLLPVPDGNPLKVNIPAVAKFVSPLLEELEDLKAFDSDTIQKLDDTMKGIFKEPLNWKDFVECLP